MKAVLFAVAALAVMAGCVSAADAQQRHADEDFTTLYATNDNPSVFGIWSDGRTIWVADQNDQKIYAYHMNGERDSDRDFTTPTGGSREPSGIWSDGRTMWVVIWQDKKVYAYKMSDQMRDSDRDFNTVSSGSRNIPYGIWSDGRTMWVADWYAERIYAYHMNGTRDGDSDFTRLSANGNNDPYGIWSDGTTMWVADQADDKIYAYKMSDKSRDTTKEFTLSDGNNDPTGIWSDCRIMWVADNVDDKLFAYRMPAGTVCPPTGSSSSGYTPPPPPDTTPPRVVSVERTGEAAVTTDHALSWTVRFSEPVVVYEKGVTLRTDYTSVANATIPDLGTVRDTITADVPGAATGGSVSVDLHHPITSGLLIELVAPDCTRFTIHNQTTAFLYKLRQPNDLGDLAGVEAAGQWTLHVSDHKERWNGTLNSWSLSLESGVVVEGHWRERTITQYVAGPGNYTLSLDGYDIRDRSGNRLTTGVEPEINEPYLVEAAVRTCRTG